MPDHNSPNQAGGSRPPSTKKPARPPGAHPGPGKKPPLATGRSGAATKKPSPPMGRSGAATSPPTSNGGAATKAHERARARTAGEKSPMSPGVKTKKPSLPADLKAPGKKPSLPPGFGNGADTKEKSESKLERIKVKSRGLRGSLPEDLKNDSDHFEEAGRQVLKFHGIYQQDDRDRRKGGKEFEFMVRTRIPGGRVTADQYLVHDELSDRYGNGTLRITTRQGFQLHGVLKHDLANALRAINESLLTTLSACGDVARNLMISPAPPTRSYHDDIHAAAAELGQRLLPKTRAYHDVWLNGDKVYDGKKASDVEEPLYGEAYLPRKFKVGIAFPGDNSIDVYTQDVGLIAVVEDDRLRGFNVLVGGGLGMTHNKPETYPRLADPIGFVPTEKMVEVVENIVIIQRDNGDRIDRRHARLKYLIDDWGLDRFTSCLEERLGFKLAPVVETPSMELELYLGWNEQSDGRSYLGISIENGRIKDERGLRLKSGLRAVIERFRPGVRLTPNHDILLTDLRREDRDAVDSILAEHGIPQHLELSNARKYSMACPALPTCGLAIAESERVLPAIIDELEAELGRLGLQDERLSVRMTGCPNGCARPYVADIGFVGRSLDRYTVFLGGRMDGTRLNTPFRDLVPLNELIQTLRPVLVGFRVDRLSGETFGDYCARLGAENLKALEERREEYATAI